MGVLVFRGVGVSWVFDMKKVLLGLPNYIK